MVIFFDFEYLGGDIEQVAQHSAGVEGRFEVPDDEAGLVVQRCHAVGKEDFGAGAFAVFDVIGMIDDPACVGVLVIDSDLHFYLSVFFSHNLSHFFMFLLYNGIHHYPKEKP
jgi:hypothetical protein